MTSDARSPGEPTRGRPEGGYQEMLKRWLRASGASAVGYPAAEDSALLREALSQYAGDSVLEMGAGGGGNLRALADRFRLRVGTDLFFDSSAREGERGFEAVLVDRASCFRDASFEVVAFNPPYLPSGTIEDVAVDGGRGGIEVPILFLQEALRVVEKGGRVLALLSTGGDLGGFERWLGERGLRFRVVRERRLFYETIRVYEIRAE